MCLEVDVVSFLIYHTLSATVHTDKYDLPSTEWADRIQHVTLPL